MCDLLDMILPLENQYLSLLDIYHVIVIFLFVSFSLEVLKTIPLDYFVLLNKRQQTMRYSTLWMHLLDCDFSLIHPPLRPSRLSNMLNLLHTLAFYKCILLMLKKKFQYSMASNFNCLGMATNSPSSVYKPLYEWVGNFPRLCELCITFSIAEQFIPSCIVSSFATCFTCLEHYQV